MSDAREVLNAPHHVTAWHCVADPATFPGCGQCVPCQRALAVGWQAAFMRDALLAVLDECDRLDGEESGVYPGIWFDALAHASDRIHAAIDKALGVTDE